MILKKLGTFRLLIHHYHQVYLDENGVIWLSSGIGRWVDKNLEYVMDKKFWLRAGMAGFKMHYLENQVLANFRLVPGTKSFKQTPRFSAEWLGVLENAFQHPALEHIPLNTKENVLRKTKARYHLAYVIKAIEVKNRRQIFQHLRQAVK